MRPQFEATVAHILPYNPVSKKKAATGKSPVAQILAATAEDVDVFMSTATKGSIGKTGVHIQYDTTAEYHPLTVEQKNDLHEWRSDKLGS